MTTISRLFSASVVRQLLMRLPWGLTEGISGRCLELGSNPYFTTMLLRQFSSLDRSYPAEELE